MVRLGPGGLLPWLDTEQGPAAVVARPRVDLGRCTDPGSANPWSVATGGASFARRCRAGELVVAGDLNNDDHIAGYFPSGIVLASLGLLVDELDLNNN